VYHKISEKYRKDPIPGVRPSDFDGVQTYKRQMGLPTVENPEIVREFKEEPDSGEVTIIEHATKPTLEIMQD
jgi:hypothetical protein